MLRARLDSDWDSSRTLPEDVGGHLWVGPQWQGRHSKGRGSGHLLSRDSEVPRRKAGSEGRGLRGPEGRVGSLGVEGLRAGP